MSSQHVCQMTILLDMVMTNPGGLQVFPGWYELYDWPPPLLHRYITDWYLSASSAFSDGKNILLHLSQLHHQIWYPGGQILSNKTIVCPVADLEI